VRGQIETSAVILASATPSIESRVNAAQGRYHHIRLATRFKARPLPEIAAIDLRTEAAARGKWIAPRLAGAISNVLARGEQALLFLNRRGYAPLTLPCLRASFSVPELHRLARRAPFPPRPDVPSLRPSRTQTLGLPGLPDG
jgi:primosomal protein N'